MQVSGDVHSCVVRRRIRQYPSGLLLDRGGTEALETVSIKVSKDMGPPRLLKARRQMLRCMFVVASRHRPLGTGLHTRGRLAVEMFEAPRIEWFARVRIRALERIAVVDADGAAHVPDNEVENMRIVCLHTPR